MQSFKKQVKHVLVIDDDRSVADTIVDWLNRRGFEAVAAYGGGAGLEKFRQGRFDLVITDLMMPDIDGMAVLENITSVARQVVVLMITGFADAEKAAEAFKKGAYDFIPKPLSFQAFEVIINRAVEHHRVSRQARAFHRLNLMVLATWPIWFVLGIVLCKRFW